MKLQDTTKPVLKKKKLIGLDNVRIASYKVSKLLYRALPTMQKEPYYLMVLEGNIDFISVYHWIWGAWLTQLGECATLDFRAVSWRPMVGVEIT